MLRCALALLQAEWAIRRHPFADTARRISLPLGRGAAPAHPLRAALDVRAALHSVCSRLPWRPTCLVKAIAAQHVLRRSHIPSALVLSVSPTEAPTVSAHAWLEAAGTIVTGRAEAQKYVPVYRFDNGPSTAGASVPREASSCSF